jgi:DUF1016 N-terminal domain
MTPKKPVSLDKAYPEFVSQLVGLLEQARRNSARSVNALMTPTYWEIGRRIVEQEQRGQKRAQYGKALLRRLAADLTSRFEKAFPNGTCWPCESSFWPGQFRRQCLRN